MGELSHQDVVDRLVMLKAYRDAFDNAYEAARSAYTEEELARSPFPKGDGSLYGEVTGYFSKEVKEKVEQRFEVTDMDALLADTSEDFSEWLTNWVRRHIGEAAEEYFHDVGELLDGCELVTDVTPAQPRKFRYMVVKPSETARQAVAEQLGPQFAGLLEG